VIVLAESEWQTVSKGVVGVMEESDVGSCSLRWEGRRNRTRLRLTRVSAAGPFQQRRVEEYIYNIWTGSSRLHVGTCAGHLIEKDLLELDVTPDSGDDECALWRCGDVWLNASPPLRHFTHMRPCRSHLTSRTTE